MTADTVTRVTKQSWGNRLGGSIKGIGAGFIIFLIAFPVLFWNEGRSVKRHKTLREGAGVGLPVGPDMVDPANDQRLIHVSGQMATDEILSDPEFPGVSVNALKLRRKVQMFQWIESSQSETKKKVGGGTETVTTYSYAMGWSDRLIDHTKFQEPAGHENPQAMHIPGMEFQASHVTLGAFVVPPNIVSGLSYHDRYSVPADARSEAYMSHVTGDLIYVGYDPAEPRIGDMKVEFDAVLPGLFSLVAKQTANTFAAYYAKAGGSILLVKPGFHDAETMFQAAQSANRLLTWILRLVGFLMMLIGLKMVFEPLGVLADVLPFLGNVMRVGTGFVAGVLAFVLTLITIAVAWLFYRPVLGVTLLVVAGGGIYVLIKNLKANKAASATPAAPAAPAAG